MKSQLDNKRGGDWRSKAGRILAALALALSGNAWAAAPIEEGVDYQVIESGDGQKRDGVVRVEEFFAYGCPHCHHLEAPLEAWLKDSSEKVDLVRYPLPFSQNSVAPTTAFYAARQVLQKNDDVDQLDKIHAPVFHALHEERRVFANAEEVRQFYARQGISVPADDFARVHDESAERLTREAYDVFQTTRSRGVPTLVVDGRYVVGGKGPERTVEIVDALVKKASAER